jgi:hypothetical protein
LLEACPFFDAHGYYNFPPTGSSLPRIYGGARARLFWPDVDLMNAARRFAGIVEAAFDEEAYLAAHADVRAAVESGVVTSGLEHFLAYGQRENRPIVVRPVAGWNDSDYFAANPDVQVAVNAGGCRSGLEHYVKYGQFESRLPAGDWPPCLTQVPLVRWSAGFALKPGRHGLIGAAWRHHDMAGGALLHFKLLNLLGGRASAVRATSVVEPALGAWGRENERYLSALIRNPELGGLGEISVPFTGVEQLESLGLIQPMSVLL